MRRRNASSGRRPYAEFMFSRTWATLVVAGIAQVTAGCETMNFSTNCAQLGAVNVCRKYRSQSATNHYLIQRSLDKQNRTC